MKIQVVILALALLSQYSCDNRKDIFYDIDAAPIVIVTKASDTAALSSLRDSVKLNVPYDLKYRIKDEENLNLKVIKTQGNDSVKLLNGFIHINGTQEGITLIDLKAKDSFGKESSVNLEMTVFTNIRPVARLTVTKIGELSLYEVQIDASASVDPDFRFGGKIIKYEYKIGNDYLVQNTLPIIRYVFDDIGQKTISIRVQDNNGEWSEQKTEYFMLTLR